MLRIVLVLFLIAACWALRPICVPLSPDDLVRFEPPIEQRTDRNLYLRVFQLRDGRWHQCKTWISRQLFF